MKAPSSDTNKVSIQDVVNGTPAGQKAVQRAVEASIKDQQAMTAKAQAIRSDTNELDITTRKVLYILETRKTIPSDWTSTQINEMYAKMIARHIHKYFELKGGI